ncbi:hypothetical protein ACP4OV_009666 [Aristida adscensionis]
MDPSRRFGLDFGKRYYSIPPPLLDPVSPEAVESPEEPPSAEVEPLSWATAAFATPPTAEPKDDDAAAVADATPPTAEPKEDRPLDPPPIVLLETRVVTFLDRTTRIVLQETDGPCSLIAIVNYLSLTGRVKLRETSYVKKEELTNLVFDLVFPKLKDDEVDPVIAAVQELSTGLLIDLFFNSINGFKDCARRKIFKILNVPLYHGWLLDPEEDASLIQALRDRSYNSLSNDLGTYASLKMTENAESTMSSDGRALNQSEENDREYGLIDKFLRKPCQLTKYGLSRLKESTCDRELFVLFRNYHFSVVYKHEGILHELQTSDGYWYSKKMWMTIKNTTGDGELVIGDFTFSHKQPKKSTGDKVGSETFQHKGYSRPRQFKSECYLPQERPRFAQSKPQSSSLTSSSGRESLKNVASSSQTRPTDYSRLFTDERDRELEAKFLAFLRGYKENGVLYYKGVVFALLMQNVGELRVHHDHIRCFDAELAEALCVCFHRIKQNLNRAAHLFIHDVKEEFPNACQNPIENPVVRICDLPKPKSWMPLIGFLKLQGNQPAEDDLIWCGEQSIEVRKSTPLGRVVFANILIRIARTHNDNRSWDGDWSVGNIFINHSLEIEIRGDTVEAKRDAMHHDYLRCATDVITLFELDNRIPVLFKHLKLSLTKFLTPARYSSAMLRKFQRYITTHNALRPPLANLAFYDDIYMLHKSLSPKAKRLLTAVLNSEALPQDWRSFLFDKEDSIPEILGGVYKFCKQAMLENKDYAGRLDVHVGNTEHGEDADADGCDEHGVNDNAGGRDEHGEGADVGGCHELVPGDDDTGKDGLVADKEPFKHTNQGQVLFARDVHHHGSKYTKDKKGLVPGDDDTGKNRLLADKEPFERTNQGQVLFARDVHHHGSKYTKVLEQLILNIDRVALDEDEGTVVLNELKEMLEEVLETYNRRELPGSQMLDDYE